MTWQANVQRFEPPWPLEQHPLYCPFDKTDQYPLCWANQELDRRECTIYSEAMTCALSTWSQVSQHADSSLDLEICDNPVDLASTDNDVFNDEGDIPLPYEFGHIEIIDNPTIPLPNAVQNVSIRARTPQYQQNSWGKLNWVHSWKWPSYFQSDLACYACTNDDAKLNPKKNKKRSLSLLKWLQCYAVYVAVVTKKQPETLQISWATNHLLDNVTANDIVWNTIKMQSMGVSEHATQNIFTK